ncbi:MAG TPA: hypothetical protein VF316_24905 [Polyangiaceae bacterium]
MPLQSWSPAPHAEPLLEALDDELVAPPTPDDEEEAAPEVELLEVVDPLDEVAPLELACPDDDVAPPLPLETSPPTPRAPALSLPCAQPAASAIESPTSNTPK